MSKNTKTILIALVVAGVFCLVAVVAAVGGMGLLAERFKNNIVAEPEKVQKMAQEFINYQLPDGYTERMGMDLIVYKMIMLGASDDSDAKPMILLAHFQDSSGMTPEQMSTQMQKSFEQQNGQKGATLKLVETRTVTVNGQETTLSVNEGTDSGGNTLRQWITTCPGKTGLVMILIQGETTDWDEDALNSFLASLSK